MKNENTNRGLFDLLEELKPVPPRDPHAATRGRKRFLTEAVSLREKQRHKGWIIFPFQEKRTMKLIVSTLVIVGLLFGGSATVAAAQDALPNQPLYRIKLISEDAQLWVTSDPIQQIDLLMEQEQVRLQEIQMLSAQGVIPPTDVAVRAQERIQRALRIAGQLDDASQTVMLQQIRTRLQTQEQQMLQYEQGTCTECILVLRQTREMLQLHLRQMENAPTDPDALPNQTQDQTQIQNQNRLQSSQTLGATGTTAPPYGACMPALDGTSEQNGCGTTSMATPVPQQNQGGGGGGEFQNGSGDGSSNGNGGQGGKP